MLQGPSNERLGAKCRPLEAHIQPHSREAAIVNGCTSLQSMEREDFEHDQQSLAGTDRASQRHGPGVFANLLFNFIQPASALRMWQNSERKISCLLFVAVGA